MRPTGRHDVIALELGTMRVHVVTFDAGGEGEGEPEIFKGAGCGVGEYMC